MSKSNLTIRRTTADILFLCFAKSTAFGKMTERECSGILFKKISQIKSMDTVP